ncbi:metalloregulator ArsR/SmtB family transcription factor [Novosphingobium sp. SL115]|jgi:DNA-binding transcriptional ArsR family regulator|uniref:ArsR/SmtB family transcription factor n=1 Tax=Novosphingobium sp. SL115 TaxID=2995150 RepID=UPI002274298C|nr:metalloregulator ArsR/SmtB family transcription factor [Novosphingobium sp. SL115]MCY1672543.1 metalloregulator ArsR/SmtB family transcription factor [Novosphingobium sp. SL115]
MKHTDLSELKESARLMAGRMRMLSHPERLLMLCRMDEGEVSVTELVELTGLSQSAVSQHLARLRDEGVVDTRVAAQIRFYSLKDEIVRAIIHALCEICDAQVKG